MINHILIYIGGALLIVWGIAHLFPTRSVVREFGDISTDNKYIIMMEWIVEGVTLIFIGIIVIVVSIIDLRSVVSISVLMISASMLIILAIISLFTGFKVNFLPYKLCPIIFSISAFLIFGGVLI